MEIVIRVDQLRAHTAQWKQSGQRIGFVPTMGNLHAGHYSLISLARQHADRVVASIFVNPTQFGPNEDFARYPRTLEQDQKGLAAAGCDLVFIPVGKEIYPGGINDGVKVEVPGISDILEGKIRPGHFTGVATVVAKFFNLINPAIAVFGQKDFQQLLVIRRLVQDLHFPIEIITGATVREPNGLAMSSRNQYLSEDERNQAGVIYQTLLTMQEEFINTLDISLKIEANALLKLKKNGIIPDYAVIRSAEDLSEPEVGKTKNLIALIAARMGTTRLIDNFLFNV